MFKELKLPAYFDKIVFKPDEISDENWKHLLRETAVSECEASHPIYRLYSGEIKQTIGRYTVKHIFDKTVSPDIFGTEDRGHRTGSTESFFYEDDIELFSYWSYGHPIIILYGDGKTRETTFYTFYNSFTCSGSDSDDLIISGPDDLIIMDMNRKQIRISRILSHRCEFVDFKQVSDNYAIEITRDEHYPYTGIICLEEFFFPKRQNESGLYYENSRVCVPLTDECGEKFIPVSTTETGFVVKDCETNELLPNIVTYDDAYNGKFYWGVTSKKLKEYELSNNMLQRAYTDAPKTMIDTDETCVQAELLPPDVVQDIENCHK